MGRHTWCWGRMETEKQPLLSGKSDHDDYDDDVEDDDDHEDHDYDGHNEDKKSDDDNNNVEGVLKDQTLAKIS